MKTSSLEIAKMRKTLSLLVQSPDLPETSLLDLIAREETELDRIRSSILAHHEQIALLKARKNSIKRNVVDLKTEHLVRYSVTS